MKHLLRISIAILMVAALCVPVVAMASGAPKYPIVPATDLLSSVSMGGDNYYFDSKVGRILTTRNANDKIAIEAQIALIENPPAFRDPGDGPPGPENITDAKNWNGKKLTDVWFVYMGFKKGNQESTVRSRDRAVWGTQINSFSPSTNFQIVFKDRALALSPDLSDFRVAWTEMGWDYKRDPSDPEVVIEPRTHNYGVVNPAYGSNFYDCTGSAETVYDPDGKTISFNYSQYGWFVVMYYSDDPSTYNASTPTQDPGSSGNAGPAATAKPIENPGTGDGTPMVLALVMVMTLSIVTVATLRCKCS